MERNPTVTIPSSSVEFDDDGGVIAAPPTKEVRRQSATTESTITCSSSGGSLSNGSDDVELLTTDSVDEYFDDVYIQKLNERAERENARLNLNLGLPINLTELTRRDVSTSDMNVIKRAVRSTVRFFLVHVLDKFLSMIENPLFRFWSRKLPLKFRQQLTFAAWYVYLPIHKALVGRRSGLHQSVSLEYHALTSAMWWGRLFPVTVHRMRMCLSQLHVWHPSWACPSWDNIRPVSEKDIVSKAANGEQHGIIGHLVEVYHKMKAKRTPTGFRECVRDGKHEDMIVTGQYIQHSSQPSDKVILWIYGGAFLAGDSKGNIGIAEKLGIMSGGRDCFIPDYRVAPEYHLDDALFDVTLAYEYLVYEKGIRPENILLLGISSGGGLVMLLMQAIAKARQKYENSVELPAGGVLVGPFVDYTEPKGSMHAYIEHDLVVNQSVYEEGIPFLEAKLGCHDNRMKASPVWGDFAGLPPLCICVMTKRAKNQGVDVTIGTWKCASVSSLLLSCAFYLVHLSQPFFLFPHLCIDRYVPHFSFLSPFCTGRP
jgi:acetyl esterase/lipase